MPYRWSPRPPYRTGRSELSGQASSVGKAYHKHSAGLQGSAAALTEYEDLGARIVLYPTIAANAGLNAAWHVLHDLRARGTVALRDLAERTKAGPWGRIEVRKLTGYDRIKDIEARFLTESQQRNYDDTWGHVGMMARTGGTPSPTEMLKKKKKKRATSRAGGREKSPKRKK